MPPAMRRIRRNPHCRCESAAVGPLQRDNTLAGILQVLDLRRFLLRREAAAWRHSCAQRVFRLDQDRINSLSYEQQVGCGEYVAVVVAHIRPFTRVLESLARAPLFFFVLFSRVSHTWPCSSRLPSSSAP
jgi:hypothetical protein